MNHDDNMAHTIPLSYTNKKQSSFLNYYSKYIVIVLLRIY